MSFPITLVTVTAAAVDTVTAAAVDAVDAVDAVYNCFCCAGVIVFAAAITAIVEWLSNASRSL